MSLEIRDVMVQKVITVEAHASLKETIELMNKYEVGCLIVCKNKRPIGILTERDLLKKVLAKIPDLSQTELKNVMSTPVWTAKPAMEIGDAVDFMIRQRIKKLPITDDEKLVGLVTLTDILRFQPQLIRAYKILSSDAVPPRMKKVFDYYTLLYPRTRSSSMEKLLLRPPEE